MRLMLKDVTEVDITADITLHSKVLTRSALSVAILAVVVLEVSVVILAVVVLEVTVVPALVLILAVAVLEVSVLIFIAGMAAMVLEFVVNLTVLLTLSAKIMPAKDTPVQMPDAHAHVAVPMVLPWAALALPEALLVLDMVLAEAEALLVLDMVQAEALLVLDMVQVLAAVTT